VAGASSKPSVTAAGLDPNALPEVDKTKMNFGSGTTKAWRDGADALAGTPDVAPGLGGARAEVHLGLVDLRQGWLSTG
jgi:hypothetical protein